MGNEFLFEKISEQESKIEIEVLQTLDEINPEISRKLLANLKNVEEETRLKIALVGQHNAGKSTMVSALTHDSSIKISSNVETDVTASYEWGNVLLYDTPGLYAGVKEEHDEEANKAIESSDMLVFCITSSLFDDLLITKFVELAYKRAYKNKIIIVVNKMSQEDGEYENLVKNYTATLKTTLGEQGGNLEDFPIAFVDAKDYREGLGDEDDELVEMSHFNDFIGLLNAQISEKGLYAKLATKLNLISDSIGEAIASTSTETDQNLMVILNRLTRTINRYRKEMGYFVKEEEKKLRQSIHRIGDDFSFKIGKENITDETNEQVNVSIQKATDETAESIQEKLAEINDELNEEIGDVLASDVGLHVFEQLNANEFTSSSMVAKEYTDLVQKYGNVEAFVKKGADKVVDLAFKKGADATKLVSSSGTAVHNAVLNVGHFFGHSFKPWEAVKIARGVGNVAKMVGPIMTGIQAVLLVVDKIKQEKEIQEIQKAKTQAFNTFSGIASDLIKEFDKQFDAMSAEVFDKRSEDIEKLRNDMIATATGNSEQVNKLKGFNEEIKLIMENI